MGFVLRGRIKFFVPKWFTELLIDPLKPGSNLDQWTSLILRCSYVVTIKCTLHFDVTILSSHVVTLLDFVTFQLTRYFLHLTRSKCCRIKDAHWLY